MTKRDAEEYLVALRPKPVFAPSIRKTPSRPQEQAASRHPTRPQFTTSRPAPRVSPSILQPARPELYNKKDVKRKRARRLEREAKRTGEFPSKKSRPDKIFTREEVEKAKSRYIN